MRVENQILAGLVILPVVLLSGVSSGAEEAGRPNIVFLLVDDMGQGDLGCYGNKLFEIPNIDRLRSGGMKFSHAYAACGVCSPSRAAILCKPEYKEKYLGKISGGWKTELYDLAKDPVESHDCVSELPEKTGLLRSKLNDWRRSVGAQVPNPKYDPAHPGGNK